MAGKSICLFWDNSNIFLSAQRAAEKHDRAHAKSVRIQFENLYRVATVGRTVKHAFCVGSVPPDLDTIWKRMTKDTGVRPELYERGKGSGKEQGIDQCLQVWMLRCMGDHDPEVAVLLTGDGAGYAGGAGFHADLERMHKKGWGIEVLSWDGSCASALKTWAATAGAYVKLEDHYESVTFVEGGRASKMPNLKTRQVAQPTPRPKP